MAERVTIQDIADAVGVSRNTVSKAINNTGVISDATRATILKKAAELGYKQFSYMTLPDPEQFGTTDTNKGEIAFLTGGLIGGSHFGTLMLDRLQKQATSFGYGFSMYRALPDEIREKLLPSSLDLSRVSGIICAEMFDPVYCRMLCELSIPILFIDSPVMYGEEPLPADILLMDNENCIYKAVKILKERGLTKFGFIGEIMHCRSFFDRYQSLRNALEFNGLPYNNDYFITGTPDGETDANFEVWLKRSFSNMKELPEVFFFANDFAAFPLLPLLHERNIRIPEDLKLVGFDDAPETRIVHPPLSSIHIHSQIMGHTAMNLLMSRIREPELNFRTLHTETSLYLRGSTGD